MSQGEPGKSESAKATAIRVRDGCVSAWRRFVRFLQARQYRPVWHLVAVLFIVCAASVLFYKNYHPHGTLMYTDMTWPNSLSRLRAYPVNMWVPYGSFPALGAQLWFYWIYPTASIAQLLHIPAAAYMFLIFWGTFSLAGISMYCLAYSTIRSLKLPDSAIYASFIGAVLAALVFMYNPWSLLYLREYYGYPVYALSPLIFFAMVKTFDSPRLRNIVLFSLFVVLINTSHHLIWFWALFASYLLFFLITNRFARDKLAAAAKVTGGTLALYLLLGAVWITPYLGSIAANQPIKAYYSPDFTQASLQGLSINNSLLNNFRLASFWSWGLSTVNTGTWLQVLAFTLPVLAILAFLLLRKHLRGNRVVTYWALVATIALLLATGSSFILKRYFLYFSLHAPGSSLYGWMLRVTERWLFFVPIFFGLMIGILVSRLLRKKQDDHLTLGTFSSLFKGGSTGDDSSGSVEERREKIDRRSVVRRRYQRRVIGAVLVVVLVIVSMLPVTLWAARTLFNPADVPADYQKVYDFLAKQPDGDRVAWAPFFSNSAYSYSWSPEKKLGAFSIFSSSPGLSSIPMTSNANSYYSWLESVYLIRTIQRVQFLAPEIMLSHNEMSRLYAPFTTHYLVLDRSVMGYNFSDNFTAEKSLKPVYRTKYLTVYRTDYDPGYISAVATSARVGSYFENLSVVQSLSAEQLARLAFLDGASYFGGSSSVADKFGVVDIKRYLVPMTSNGGFEDSVVTGMPPGWSFTYDNGRSRAGTEKTRAGKHSLKVANSSNTIGDTVWISTGDKPASPGDMYTFETSMKYRNVVWSLAAVEGYQASTGQWIKLIACPSLQSGDSGWQRYRCSLRVPEGITRIRPALGAGCCRDKGKGPGVTWFDDVNLSKVSGQFLADLTSGPPAPRVTYQQVDPEKFKVTVKGATSPFLLLQGENYDGLWVAKLDDRTINAVPVYSTINGFPIDKTGNFELTISYRLQPWLDGGLALSLLTVFVLLAYLAYTERERLAVPAAKVWGPTRRAATDLRYFIFPAKTTDTVQKRTHGGPSIRNAAERIRDFLFPRGGG